MFSTKQQQPKPAGNGEVDTLIGRNTRIEGDVHFTGGLYVDGQVKGAIASEAGGEAMLSISEHGHIEGEVRVPHVVVNGRLIGNIHHAEKVELLGNAHVQGNIHYKLLQMAVGAAVTGQLVQEREPARQLPRIDDET